MASLPPGLVRVAGSGLLLRLRVTPKSSSNAVEGLSRQADGTVSLQIRVTAQPDKGKANKAVIQTLARTLGVAKSQLAIASGATSRQKTVRIDGETQLALDALQDHLKTCKP
ncbi:MAG: YggU family protein [Alphaproteobacteria bacterium]|nr:YggU family protein [Alphaproteobacteria bacterium]